MGGLSAFIFEETDSTLLNSHPLLGLELHVIFQSMLAFWPLELLMVLCMQSQSHYEFMYAIVLPYLVNNISSLWLSQSF